MLFSKILENIDIYGQKFNFTVYNKLEHKTYIGGILTILTIFFIYETFVFFGKDFYLRTNPDFKNDRVQLLNYPLYNLSSNNFMFGFRVEDINRNFWNESHYFSFKVVYNNITISQAPNGTYFQTGNTINLDYSLCDKNILTNLNFSDLIDSKSFYCVKMNDTNPISIGGYWDYNFAKFIDVLLILCSNDPNKTNCASVDETLDLLKQQKFYLNILSMKYYIDVENIDNPLSRRLSYNYLQIDINYFKKQYCYFKLGVLKSDNGLIMESVNQYDSFALDYLSFDIINNLNFSKAIITTRIFFTRIVENYNRTYKKFQNLIPILMSVFNLVFIFFSKIAIFMNDFILTNKMINELFDFGHLNKKKFKKNSVIKDSGSGINHDKKIEFNSPKIGLENLKDFDKSNFNLFPDLIFKKQGTSENDDINLKNIEINELKVKIDVNEEHKKFLAEKDKFVYDLPFSVKLKSLFCRRFLSEEERENYKLFKMGRKILKEKTDIVGFLKSMEDMNEMKFVLFSKIQASCFNFIRKPPLGNTEKDKLSELFKFMKDDEVSQKIDIVNYFVNDARSVNSEYDHKFLEFLENDIKSVIDNINYVNEFKL